VPGIGLHAFELTNEDISIKYNVTLDIQPMNRLVDRIKQII